MQAAQKLEEEIGVVPAVVPDTPFKITVKLGVRWKDIESQGDGPSPLANVQVYDSPKINLARKVRQESRGLARGNREPLHALFAPC